MSSASDTIIDHLRELQAREEAQAQTFEGQLPTAPPGPYRSFARRHLDETRRHSQQLSERLTDLGAGTGPLALGIGFVEEVVGRAVAVALAPLGLFAGRTPPEEVLRQARDAIADEARERAGYEVLERLASAAGDRITASLARRIREDEERALEQLEEMLGPLADRVARARFGAEAGEDEAEEEPRAEEPGDEQERDEPDEPEETGEDRAAVPGRGDTNGGPVVARDEAEAERDREPPDPRDRDGVPGPEMHIEPPWDDYDTMTAAQVLERLRDADEALVGVVRLYEQANKRRKTILQARTQA